jgi:integrase
LTWTLLITLPGGVSGVPDTQSSSLPSAGSLGAPGLYQTVTRRTKAEFGRAIHPHLFRDIAATTLALARPEQALLSRDLLHHSDFRMTEGHYLHAQTAEAGRSYASQIGSLRRTLKNGPRVGDERGAERPLK